MTKERLARVLAALKAEQARRRRAAALKRVLADIDAAAAELGVDFYTAVIIRINTRA